MEWLKRQKNHSLRIRCRNMSNKKMNLGTVKMTAVAVVVMLMSVREGQPREVTRFQIF